MKIEMKIPNKFMRESFVISAFLAVISVSEGCSSYTQFRTPDENNIPYSLYSLPPGEFGKLWQQRTVHLEIQNPENSSVPLLGGSQDEQRRGNRLIPMDINVTFLDSEVVSAGLNEFENLAGMSGKERADYENRYKEQFVPKDSYVFWMEMNSPYSEDALGTDKWTFYLEDEKGNTYEPGKITKLESKSLSAVFHQQDNTGLSSTEGQRGNFQRLNNRTFLLSYAKKGINGKDILQNSKSIKMVYFEWSTREVKREGTLELSSTKQ